MATLTGNKVKDTYYKLLQVDNGQLVQNGIGSPITGSINLSGSLHITGSSTIGGDLAVTGKVTATQYIATLVSSSVIFESGSTAFGNSLDDIHTFTGSILQTGSNTRYGDFVSLDVNSRLVQLADRAQLRVIPTGSIVSGSSTATMIGQLATIRDVFDKSVSSIYGNEVQIGAYNSGNKFTQNIKLGTSGSLIAISGSVGIEKDLRLGGYTDVSASLTSTIDSIEALSGSAHTDRVAKVNVLSGSTHIDRVAKVDVLSGSAHTDRIAKVNTLSGSAHIDRVAKVNVLSGSAHTDRVAKVNILSGSSASALRTEYKAGDTALSSSILAAYLKNTGGASSGSFTHSGSAYFSGSIDHQGGNIISINDDTSLVQLSKRIQFRALPSGSLVTGSSVATIRGHIGTTIADDQSTAVSIYGNQVQIATFNLADQYTQNIRMGSSGSLIDISGSTTIHNTLTLGNFADVSASLAIVTDAQTSNVSHSSGVVDLPGKQIQYSNVYATEGDLPTAATYHGMFAHVHATGLGYFAHGGSWIKLANSGSEASAIRTEYRADDATISSSFATTQGAQDTRLVALESFTGSLDVTYATDAQVNTISQSVKTYADAAVSTESSSLAPLYRAEINTVSSSAHTHRETQIAPLNTFTGSIQTEVDGLSAVTSSYETSGSVAADYISIEKLKTFITGSYAEFQTAIGSL